MKLLKSLVLAAILAIAPLSSANAVLVCQQWLKGAQFFDATGNPLAAGDIFIQDAGTSSLRTTYSNSGGTVANTYTSSRIVLDSGGKLDESVYVPVGAWKYTLRDSGGSTVETEDNILGCLDTSVFLTGTVTAETPVIVKTGDYTIVNGDQTKVINANPTSGTFTLTLPSAVTVGDGWRITIRHTGTANNVVVATVSAQTIDGQSSLTLSTYLEAATLVSDGANWHIADTANPGIVARTYTASGMGQSIVGGHLVISVASNELTLAVKTAAGNDPTSYAPVKILFRGQAAADEEYSIITLVTSTSFTVTSGSKLGASDGTAFKLWAVGFNDGGTFRLGVINSVSGVNIYPVGQFPVASSSAEGGAGAADSAHVFYTSSAVSSKPYQVLAYASWESGLSTAGTWSTGQTRFQLFGPNVPLPGTVIQTQVFTTGAVATGTTVMPYDDTTPQNTEGNQYMSQAITPTSASNILEVESQIQLANSASGANNVSAALFRDTTANSLTVLSGNSPNSIAMQLNLKHHALAGATSETTFKIRAGCDAAGTTTFNGAAGARRMNDNANSYIVIKERMSWSKHLPLPLAA